MKRIGLGLQPNSVREFLLSASPAMRLGLSPTTIPSALTEKSVHLRGR
jgi:hypothetical protein